MSSRNCKTKIVRVNRKREEEEKVQSKIKELEASRGGGFFSSLAGVFGYGKKTPEEEEAERKKQEEER